MKTPAGKYRRRGRVEVKMTCLTTWKKAADIKSSLQHRNDTTVDELTLSG